MKNRILLITAIFLAFPIFAAPLPSNDTTYLNRSEDPNNPKLKIKVKVLDKKNDKLISDVKGPKRIVINSQMTCEFETEPSLRGRQVSLKGNSMWKGEEVKRITRGTPEDIRETQVHYLLTKGLHKITLICNLRHQYQMPEKLTPQAVALCVHHSGSVSTIAASKNENKCHNIRPPQFEDLEAAFAKEGLGLKMSIPEPPAPPSVTTGDSVVLGGVH